MTEAWHKHPNQGSCLEVSPHSQVRQKSEGQRGFACLEVIVEHLKERSMYVYQLSIMAGYGWHGGGYLSSATIAAHYFERSSMVRLFDFVDHEYAEICLRAW